MMTYNSYQSLLFLYVDTEALEQLAKQSANSTSYQPTYYCTPNKTDLILDAEPAEQWMK